MNEDLLHKRCKPCEGGVKPLTPAEAKLWHPQLNNWTLTDRHLEKEVRFKNFVAAMKVVNKVAELAEEEGHHPDLFIQYNKVKFTLWTHAIGGLSENDFILAKKIDSLCQCERSEAIPSI